MMVQQKPTIQNQPIKLKYEIDGDERNRWKRGKGDMPDFTHGKKK
jgi:hypothetical protein